VADLAPNGPHTIVHNAAVAVRKGVVDTSPAELDGQYAVNVGAPYLLT